MEVLNRINYCFIHHINEFKLKYEIYYYNSIFSYTTTTNVVIHCYFYVSNIRIEV